MLAAQDFNSSIIVDENGIDGREKNDTLSSITKDVSFIEKYSILDVCQLMIMVGRRLLLFKYSFLPVPFPFPFLFLLPL
jgi:hypothetical protein